MSENHCLIISLQFFNGWCKKNHQRAFHWIEQILLSLEVHLQTLIWSGVVSALSLNWTKWGSGILTAQDPRLQLYSLCHLRSKILSSHWPAPWKLKLWTFYNHTNTPTYFSRLMLRAPDICCTVFSRVLKVNHCDHCNWINFRQSKHDNTTISLSFEQSKGKSKIPTLSQWDFRAQYMRCGSGGSLIGHNSTTASSPNVLINLQTV